jgi:hypothetical protein
MWQPKVKNLKKLAHLDVFIEKYIGFGLLKWTFKHPFCYNVMCFYQVAYVHMIMPS